MHWSIQRGTTVVQIIYDGVPAALFASEDHVRHPSFDAFTASVLGMLQPGHADLPVLPSFGAPVYASVSVEHVQ